MCCVVNVFVGMGMARLVNKVSLEGGFDVEGGVEESKRFRLAVATWVPYDCSGLVYTFFFG